MNNKIYFFFLIIISFTGCQNSGTEFYSEDFKWQVTIPKEYINRQITEKTQEKGKKMIEEAYNQKISVVAIPMFNFIKGRATGFQAQYTTLDSTKNFLTEFNQANEIFQRTFKHQLPNSKLDTQNSTKTISGLEFQTFEMKIYTKNDSWTKFQNYSRMFGNKKLDLLLVFQDEKSENELLKALEKSTFE